MVALSGLRSALRLLAPSVDTAWLWRPNGISLGSRLAGPRKPNEVPDSMTLFRWGQDLIDEGKAQLQTRHALLTIRDGVMIRILACRPLRRRTMVGLRLDQHLRRIGERWKLTLEAEDMKNRRAVEFFLPAEVTADVDHYIEQVRPLLMGPTAGDAVWIGQNGRQLTKQALSSGIWRRAEVRFGFGFGPHRFRHAYATTVISANPASPGSAAAVLAVGAQMVEAHYNLGNTTLASRALNDVVDAERDRWRTFARRKFRRDADRTRSDERTSSTRRRGS
ncbi:MAG: hypothetical protein AB7O80_17870 [Acetobacteraceae bacterium]